MGLWTALSNVHGLQGLRTIGKLVTSQSANFAFPMHTFHPMIQSEQPLFLQLICENVHVSSKRSGLATFETPARPPANTGLPNTLHAIRDATAEVILM